MEKVNLVPSLGGDYDPHEVIRLGLPAVLHLVPAYVAEWEVKLALVQSQLRCVDIFYEVSLFPKERLRTPEQVALAIQQVLFNSFESALTQLTLHKIPV